uniref:SET domain-containing protein n=1 Tax=Terrapene triunguis TaxID=2587831 RepID=A0A674IR73_9SAUR
MAASMGDLFCFCADPAGPARARVEVRFISSLKGKGLFATRNIHKGETIFVEKPVVSSQFLWNALYRYKGERRVIGFKTRGTLSSPTLMSCITKP